MTFQGTIYIENNKITGLIPNNYSGVKIINNQIIKEYPNGYALPGFVDSHCHFLGLGSRLLGLSLNDAISADECVSLAMKHNNFRGEWLVGNGWNQELWNDKKFPTAKMLDAVFPNQAVSLLRIDGHTAWINSYAMKIAGINKNTPDPVGGFIHKDKAGNPTGILIDNAIDLVSKYIPSYTDDQISAFLHASANELSKNGITEIHDMDVTPKYLNIYNKTINNEFPIKLNCFLKAQNNEWINNEFNSLNDYKIYNNQKINVCGLKFYADGALGSRGAALFEPYSDMPTTYGLMLIRMEELFNKMKLGIENGFMIAIHAIGDAGNHLALDIYRELFDSKIANRSSFLRLEHAQMIIPSDIFYFNRYNIIASVQPYHCISDHSMAPDRIGNERCLYSYRWQSILDTGRLMCAGSDFPVEPHNPLTGIDAFVNRKYNDKILCNPYERISRLDALRAYTLNAHKAMNSNTRGEIKIGNDADIVIWDCDLLNCPDDKILDAKVINVI